METKMFNLLVASELAECDRMLEALETAHNAPERIATRARIEEHIGRPLFRDDLVSTKSIKSGIISTLKEDVTGEIIDFKGLLDGLNITEYLAKREKK